MLREWDQSFFYEDSNQIVNSPMLLNRLTKSLPILTLVMFVGTPGLQAQNYDTILDVADKAGSFTTLIAAVQAAGLEPTLDSDGPFTVFAPTDEAFAKLPVGVVEDLLLPENREQLESILKYHVVAGRIASNNLLSTQKTKTINGASLPIGLNIAGAAIIKADLKASNGIIHVVDSVLMPGGVDSSVLRVMNVIEEATRKGSAFYNNGQVMACATIYEMTAQALLASSDLLPLGTQKMLTRALTQMESTHSSDERAWIMRRGLDSVYRSMTKRRMSPTIATRN